MPTSPTNSVVRHLHRAALLRDSSVLGDGELLDLFVERHDAAALGTLVRKHGPMVWGVCRRVLHNEQDAEDAFQATFLVLVRKASSISPRSLVGNWLYGVAHQTALHARRTAARRRAKEVQVQDMPAIEAAQRDPWPDLRDVLDEELSRLPDTYRAVVVLCDLEGRTRKEVALQLGVPEGTVAGRLARARAMLAKRLTERGVTLSCGALAALLAQHAAAAGVPNAVASRTIHTVTTVAAGQVVATGTASANVAALTEGVLNAMLVNKLKGVVAAVLALGLVALGATALTFRTAGAQGDQPPATGKRVSASEKPEREKGEGRPPPPDRTEAPAPTGVDDPMWMVEFRWAYGLRDGELIRRVAPPYPECRAEYFKERTREVHKRLRLEVPPEALNRDYSEYFTRFMWKDRWTAGDLMVQVWPIKSDEGVRLAQVINLTTGLAPNRIEGDAELLEAKVTGDFVVRVGADPEKLAAALERILRKECGLNASLTVREVERKAYVLSGKYQSNPLPNRKKDFVELYGLELTEGGGGANGGLRELAENAERFTGVPVILGEVDGAPPRVGWHFNARSPATPEEQAQDSDPESVMKNITAQTGLTAKREQRKVKVLTVNKAAEPAKQPEAKEAKPVEDARAKTVTLPATVEKVDAGAHVLTVRSRVFQHAGKPISDKVPDDKVNRTVTILGHPTTDGTGRDIIVSPTRMADLSVSAGARIKAGGKDVQLAALEDGDHVNLELTVSEGGLVVVGIERVDARGAADKHR